MTKTKTPRAKPANKGLMLKQVARRQAVNELICTGYRVWEIAEELQVNEDTVRQDLKWLFDSKNFDMEEEKKKMLAQVEWSVKEAARKYNEAEDEESKRAWLNLFNQIQRTKALFMGKNTIIVNNQTNIIAPIYQLKKLQETGTIQGEAEVVETNEKAPG